MTKLGTSVDKPSTALAATGTLSPVSKKAQPKMASERGANKAVESNANP